MGEACTGFWWENLKERDNWGDLGIDGRIISILLTSLSRVLIEKLTGLHLVKKFPASYGTRRFITAFTSARHPSLS
jgi:hypothetical protein